VGFFTFFLERTDLKVNLTLKGRLDAS